MKRFTETETWQYYLAAVAELDLVLEELTREFCANDCPITLGIGCCHDDKMCYTGFFNDEGILREQRAEAENNGWIEHEEPYCPFIIPGKGCSLTLYKPPVCFGNLCEDLERALKSAHHDSDEVNAFTSIMEWIAFNSEEATLEETIAGLIPLIFEAAEHGRALIDNTPSGLTPYEHISLGTYANV